MLFFLFLLHYSLSCNLLSCDQSSTTTQCVSASTSISLSACSSGYSCPLASLSPYLYSGTPSNVSCIASQASINPCTQSKVTTGHTCCSNSNCSTNKCVDGQCEGKFLYDLCYEDSDCQTQMYCDPSANSDSGTCQTAFTTGQDCDFDNECASGLGCSRGSCVQLLSLEIGARTDQAVFCITNYMNPSYRCDAVQVFVNNKLLSSPFECSTGDSCVYKYQYSGGTIGTYDCECPGDNSGKGYCGRYAMYDNQIASNGNINLHYLVSNCSGNDASSTDPDTLLECGSITIDIYYYFNNWTGVVSDWTLYNSHAIDTCALGLGLFDPSWSMSRAVYLAASVGFLSMSYI